MQQDIRLGEEAEGLMADSQFPFWDFFECNFLSPMSMDMGKENSQFPFWDFFECNKPPEPRASITPHNLSQFPFWDFFECNRCRFGCFSGNWRGKSAGHTAYPAPATVFIKIRRLFKFLLLDYSSHPHQERDYRRPPYT